MGDVVNMERGTQAGWGNSNDMANGVAVAYGERHDPPITEQPTVRVAAAPGGSHETALKPKRQQLTGGNKSATNPMFARAQLATITLLALVETGLLLISLIPASRSINLGWTSTDGPFPTATAPIITAIFYLAPFGCGLLARRWDVAIFAATLPAWLSLGLYTIAASTQNGIFAFTRGDQPTYLVGTLELFAALGAFGWIMRRIFTTKDAAPTV